MRREGEREGGSLPVKAAEQKEKAINFRLVCVCVCIYSMWYDL